MRSDSLKVGARIRVVRPRTHLALGLGGHVMEIDRTTGGIQVQLDGSVPKQMRQHPVGHARENWVRMRPEHVAPYIGSPSPTKPKAVTR